MSGYSKKNTKKINQHELNKRIEFFVNAKDTVNHTYTKKDIEFINGYEGSGGQAAKGARGEGLLYEYFTPQYICDLMHQLALYHGYDGGTILEPSCGTGRMLKPFEDKTKFTAFEINHIAKRIAEINYPQATIYEQHFETAFLSHPRYTERLRGEKFTWLDGYPFSLVIGNPPFGKYKNIYSSYFRTPKFIQFEMFFMYYGMKLLNKGGLLIYLTSSNFLRNGLTYENQKEYIGKLADIIDAYRLPPVIKSTSVPLDIIILKRK